MMYGYLAKIYFPVFVCSLVGDIAAVHLTHHKVVYSIPIASFVVSVTLRRKPLHLQPYTATPSHSLPTEIMSWCPLASIQWYGIVDNPSDPNAGHTVTVTSGPRISSSGGRNPSSSRSSPACILSLTTVVTTRLEIACGRRQAQQPRDAFFSAIRYRPQDAKRFAVEFAPLCSALI
ncbi:hypothetical protein F442_16567 [Phytophthora nicotianae P10297]|uniref:Uncharacterized protein n=1 Tax=Phytophthora nicotianae P10297 TaxID=1317064 RepID=W2YJJ8_PHYNI|nr:hypothetical protein F442_16567 [Phytophthora nicotianae P10297]